MFLPKTNLFCHPARTYPRMKADAARTRIAWLPFALHETHVAGCTRTSTELANLPLPTSSSNWWESEESPPSIILSTVRLQKSTGSLNQRSSKSTNTLHNYSVIKLCQAWRPYNQASSIGQQEARPADCCAPCRARHQHQEITAAPNFAAWRWQAPSASSYHWTFCITNS